MHRPPKNVIRSWMPHPGLPQGLPLVEARLSQQMVLRFSARLGLRRRSRTSGTHGARVCRNPKLQNLSLPSQLWTSSCKAALHGRPSIPSQRLGVPRLTGRSIQSTRQACLNQVHPLEPGRNCHRAHYAVVLSRQQTTHAGQRNSERSPQLPLLRSGPVSRLLIRWVSKSRSFTATPPMLP